MFNLVLSFLLFSAESREDLYFSQRKPLSHYVIGGACLGGSLGLFSILTSKPIFNLGNQTQWSKFGLLGYIVPTVSSCVLGGIVSGFYEINGTKLIGDDADKFLFRGLKTGACVGLAFRLLKDINLTNQVFIDSVFCGVMGGSVYAVFHSWMFAPEIIRPQLPDMTWEEVRGILGAEHGFTDLKIATAAARIKSVLRE